MLQLYIDRSYDKLTHCISFIELLIENLCINKSLCGSKVYHGSYWIIVKLSRVRLLSCPFSWIGKCFFEKCRQLLFCFIRSCYEKPGQLLTALWHILVGCVVVVSSQLQLTSSWEVVIIVQQWRCQSYMFHGAVGTGIHRFSCRPEVIDTVTLLMHIQHTVLRNNHNTLRGYCCCKRGDDLCFRLIVLINPLYSCVFISILLYFILLTTARHISILL